MSERKLNERRKAIVSLVASQGDVSVDQLVNQFSTSEVTIRKDLAELEKQQLLLRRYGGAVALPAELSNDFISQRKQAIADAAARLIIDFSRIVIDSGSTTAALIPRLNDKKDLVVMTNSLTVANQLRLLNNEPKILMTGGTWDPQSESFQGKVAEQVLRAYDFEQLFIGADGIDINRGTTSFNELLNLSQIMAEVSQQVIVMLESEKVGRRIPNLELHWQQVDILITDAGVPSELIKQIEQQDVQVIIA